MCSAEQSFTRKLFVVFVFIFLVWTNFTLFFFHLTLGMKVKKTKINCSSFIGYSHGLQIIFSLLCLCGANNQSDSCYKISLIALFSDKSCTVSVNMKL